MSDNTRNHHEYERIVISGEGAAAREIRIYGSEGRLILEGWQVVDDGGQTAWISEAGAIAVFAQPLHPGETTEAGPLWVFDNFGEVKEMAPAHHHSWLKSPKPSANDTSPPRPNSSRA